MNDKPNRPVAKQIRLWPAVVVVAAQLLVVLLVSRFGATTLGDLYGAALAPMAAALLLLVWWLFASRASLAERLLGAVIFILPFLWLGYYHRPFGFMVILRAMPVATTAVVAVLCVAAPVAWSRRRWLGVATLLLCGVVFTPVRIEGMRGNFVPDLAWAWTPTFEERIGGAPDSSATSNRVADVPREAGPGDWPRFRGAAIDSVVPGVTFSTDWTTPPQELWRRPVGLGWASFAAVGGSIFTQEQRGEDEVVVCYEAATGDQVWAVGEPIDFEDPMGPGPRSTPTFADGQLYTLGVEGAVRCLDAGTGEVRWERELGADTGAKTPQWGFSSSPLVTEDLVLVYAGAGEDKAVVAYARDSGEVRWTGGTGSHGYSSVSRATIAGAEQYLIADDSGIQALDPGTGAVLWAHDWKVNMNPRVVQPTLLEGNAVYLGTAGGLGLRRLRLAREGQVWEATEEWTARHFRPYFNDYVYHEGCFFGYDGNRFACIDATTGEEQWRGDRLGGQVLLLPDMDRLLILTEKGSVLLVPATPERFSIEAEYRAIEGKTWNHPVIAHGRLYVRNSIEAACFALNLE